MSIFRHLPTVHRISMSKREPPRDVVLSLGDVAHFRRSSGSGVVALELSPASDRAGVDALDGPGVDSRDEVFVQGLGFLDASLTTLDQDEPEGCWGFGGLGDFTGGGNK